MGSFNTVFKENFVFGHYFYHKRAYGTPNAMQEFSFTRKQSELFAEKGQKWCYPNYFTLNDGILTAHVNGYSEGLVTREQVENEPEEYKKLIVFLKGAIRD